MKRTVFAIILISLMLFAASCDIHVNGMGSDEISQTATDTYEEYPDTVPDDFIKSARSDMFEYDIYGRHAEITKYIGKSVSVVIPRGIENKKVTVICEQAFTDMESVTEVHISDTVEQIGAKAFYRCFYLEKLTGGENVSSIGNYAFAYDARLTEVALGEQLVSIGDKAFMWCEKLKKIFIPASCNTIGYRAFLCCTGADEIVFEDGQLDTVGEDAFMGLSSVESVCYPYISVSAGDGMFKHSKGLKNLTFDPRVTRISKTAFQNSHALETVTVPEQIDFMGDYAFGSCHSLKEITIENKDLLFGCKRDEEKNSHLDIWFHAFLQIEGLTVRGHKGSTAEEIVNSSYGKRNEWVFESID